MVKSLLPSSRSDVFVLCDENFLVREVRLN